MELQNALKARRTIRIFKRDRIETEVLKSITDDARLAPSGANLQPLNFIPVNKPEVCDEIFKNVKWAGYTAPLGVPTKEQAPAAYIAVVVDKRIKQNGNEDAAFAELTITLSALDKGIGSCIIAAFSREELNKILNIDENRYIHTVVALGYPAQGSVYEDNDETVKYYLDEKGDFHVPKRSLDKIADFKYCE